LAKPLYETTKRGEQESLVGEEEPEKAFREIKRAPTNAPALGLLDVMKPFFVYVHEQKEKLLGSSHSYWTPGTIKYLTNHNNLMLFPEAGQLACMR
jgi:hypothetical protein